MVKSDVCGDNRPAAPATGATQADDRSALVALWQRGERYQFLDLAYRYLSAVEHDPEITLEVLKALVEIGLGGPARELLHQRRDLAAAGLDPAELRKSLASVPTGRVPWEALRPQFEANLAALLRGRVELQAHEQDIRQSLRGLQLFRSSDGLLHLSRRDTGRLRQWLPGLIDSSQVATMEIPVGAAGPGPVLIGIELNPLIERVYRATQPCQGAASVPLLIVDEALHHLAAWLHVTDRTEVLDDERVYFFIGHDALARYERFLTENEDIAIPDIHLASSGTRDLSQKVRDIGQRIMAGRNEASQELAARIELRARQRSADDWTQRLQPGASILGFTSRFTTMLQYSMRDIGYALQELGYRFEPVMEKADHRCLTTLTIRRAAYEADPALIILINHFRHEQPQAFGGAPILTWVQDPTDLVLSRQTGRSIGKLDFVCGYYRNRCIDEFSYPPSRFFGTFLPVSTRTFHDGPVEPSDAQRYDCDLMYVGHLHANVDEHGDTWRSRTAPQLHPLLDRIHHEVAATLDRGEHLQFPRPLVQSIASDMKVALDDSDLENLSNFYAYRLFDILFRRQTLCWVAQWAERTGRVFKLYGRGWQDDPVLRRYAVGPSEHGEPLRRAYRCAKLVLQTLPTGLMHQRTFEGLASGSLVISRFTPESFARMSIEQFEQSPKSSLPPSTAAVKFPGLARVVFRSAEELEQLCERLLADAPYRNEVQTQMRDVVLREFTYTSVLDGLLTKIRSKLGGGAAVGLSRQRTAAGAGFGQLPVS